MVPISEQLRASYDLVPYVSAPFAQTHPDSLRTVAALAGMTAAPAESCRVLELGCASAGNLAPMAQTLPGSKFLGIDFSSQEISVGLQMVKSAGLKNIELRCQNLLDFNETDRFDYIIAHGVYSWVPPEVRNKLLRICATNLAPQGIAYLSFNTLPGWHLKRIARDMMMYHAKKAHEEKDRAPMARGILELAKGVPFATPAYSAVISEANERIAKETDGALLHDDMELANEPIYLEQFVNMAAAAGLRYIGVASQNIELFHLLPAELQKRILGISRNYIEREQYTDFFTGRAYRDAVLCRSDARFGEPMGISALSHMYVASNLIEEKVDSSSSSGESIRFVHATTRRGLTVTDPGGIAVFRRAKECWPAAVPFEELVQSAMVGGGSRDTEAVKAAVAERVMYAYKTDLMELWTRPLDFLDMLADHPCVTPLARVQLKAKLQLTNLRHAWFVPDAAMLKFMPLFDGTRDRAELLREIAAVVQRGEFVVQGPVGAVSGVDKLGEFVDAMIKSFTAASFLWKQLN